MERAASVMESFKHICYIYVCIYTYIHTSYNVSLTTSFLLCQTVVCPPELTEFVGAISILSDAFHIHISTKTQYSVHAQSRHQAECLQLEHQATKMSNDPSVTLILLITTVRTREHCCSKVVILLKIILFQGIIFFSESEAPWTGRLCLFMYVCLFMWRHDIAKQE